MSKKAKIYYFSLTDEMTKREKLDWFAENHIKNTPFEIIKPDKNANWLNITDNDFEELLPLYEKKNKKVLFEFSSLGVSTNRDEWVYDFSKENLEKKISFFIEQYSLYLENNTTDWPIDIKWSRDLKKKFEQKKEIEYSDELFKVGNYRPFVKKHFYSEKILNDILTQNHYDIFGDNLVNENVGICFSGKASNKNFQTIATTSLWGLDFLEKTNMLPLYRYDSSGNRIENITDWGLYQFRDYYEDSKVLKADIFHYVYAVLHNPAYRKKYEQNLKREFPRVPFYADFWKWASWGEALMALHIDYELVEAYDLEVVASRIPKENPQAKLRLDKNKNGIILDENTEIHGIPKAAFSYKLGNRSALEWILDQYKEKKPRDPTIREKFNTYRFADYKEQVIDLLKRVTTVSLRTMEIVNQMAEEEGHD
ncbi:MAG: hypothetical protein JJT94_04430 [Bernardetiaceae bacterium]|nr:hypothetical protein [Bernardetiaceae bacterium]